MDAVLTILRKDLRLRLRDRSVLLFALLIPFGLMLVLSSVFPDAESLSITAVVVDEDEGEIGRTVREHLVPRLLDEGLIVDGGRVTRAEATSRIEGGTASVAWVVPAGTSERVESGGPLALEVLANPDRTLALEIGRGVAEAFSANVDRVLGAVSVASAATGTAPDGALVDAARRAAEHTARPVTTTTETVASTRLPMRAQMTAGMAAFFLLFTVQLGVIGLLEERQQGTLPRLRSAPIGIGAVLGGKAAGSLVVGLVSMTVLAVAASVLLGAHWGPWAGVALSIVAIVVTGSALMAAVGTFANSAEQASNLQSIVAVGLGLIGGVFVPVQGTLAGTLAMASPHHWFLTGLGAQSATGRPSSVLPAVGAQLALAAVALVVAVVRTRRELAR